MTHHLTLATRPKDKAPLQGSSGLSLEIAEALIDEWGFMTLLDALLAEQLGKPVVVPCKVTTIAEVLPEPYKSAFVRIATTTFTDGGLPSTDASKKLADAGIYIGETTITRHRRGLCKCKREG